MADVSSELQEVQQEIADVKKALRSNEPFLGMSGDTLQRYFLSLNERENLFLSKQLQMSSPASLPANSAPPAAVLLGASGGTTPAHASSTQVPTLGGYGGGGAVPAARDLPAGAAEAFDRESLPSVFAHMGLYEGSAVESAKTLRALASLAYANASQVGDHPDALPQALRLLSLHPTEENVQINGMRALCNMAYDPAVALGRLSTPSVLGAFVSAMARKGSAKEISAKASEAVARVVAAEVGPESGSTPPVPAEKGPLRSLFSVVEFEDVAGREVVVQLVQQLVSNEVAVPELLVQRIVDLAAIAKESGPAAAAWLVLAKQIAMAEIATMSELLIARGAIGAAAGLMVAQHSFGPAQLAGIEAMSGLVGSRWMGLQAFAAERGIERIEVAMTTHVDESVLQTKGIRALASGIQWPEDIQTKAGFNYRQGVKMTKIAMAKHGESEDLQVAGLEALHKYLHYDKCIEEVKHDGGTGLVKAVMMRHSSIEKVKTLGSQILDTLGEKDWKPKGAAGAN